MYKRLIQPDSNKSFFLFGPRQTGKTAYVKSLLADEDLYFDLLPQRNFLRYAKDVGRLREEILAHARSHKHFTCVIDEIQKLPALLDEVHELIESHGPRFILTGSSSRKLRRGGANLLAGRAYTYHLFPLTPDELGPEFDLNRALRVGTLPILWRNRDEDATEFLRAYTETYLREEVATEGLVRNIGPFSHFLDIMAANDGEIVNYSNIARECAVSVKTVQQYYQILEDTFVAYRLPAWTVSPRKRLVSHPKFYLFDPGITNALTHSLHDPLPAGSKGRRFEQFVIGQIMAAIEYRRLGWQVSYWRTNHGAEVDLLIARGRKILAAVEIKSSENIARETLSGLKSFMSSHPGVPGYVLGHEQRKRLLGDDVFLLNWDDFLASLSKDFPGAA